MLCRSRHEAGSDVRSGPLAAIYEIWRTSGPARSSTPVPIWILVFGGAFIVIGLATCVPVPLACLTR